MQVPLYQIREFGTSLDKHRSGTHQIVLSPTLLRMLKITTVIEVLHVIKFYLNIYKINFSFDFLISDNVNFENNPVTRVLTSQHSFL